MEISTEIKAKVFAQYLGKRAKVFDMIEPSKTAQYEIIDGHSITSLLENSYKDFQLVLKPLSDIKNEDAIEIFLKVESISKETLLKYEGLTTSNLELSSDARYFINTFHNNCSVYQHLISKGYDLPNYLLEGKTLKEAGLAIYEN